MRTFTVNRVLALLLLLAVSAAACSESPRRREAAPAPGPGQAPATAPAPTTGQGPTAHLPSGSGGSAGGEGGLGLPVSRGARFTPPTTVPKELRLAGFDSHIELPTCELHVSITNEAIGFGYDSAEISAAGRTGLGAVAKALSGATDVFVVGHTSTEGDAAYNLYLSDRRARAVADVLAAGVPTARFHVRGAGETEPVAPFDDTEAKRSLNRRVVVHARIKADVCN